MSVSIRIENLGKQYRLGEVNQRMLYLELQSWWARLRGKEDPNSKVVGTKRSTGKGDFWALRNVTFDVNEGDVVGVIGKNGSGKSTLLKILSEVTTPTEGAASIKGTVASLLEVGTGFHNELTGRENVYLNGSILGMNRSRIDQRYREIVEFAGVQEFMDTPVKRYSSGMKLRLAFAVAAHLDPEVLILDEVLAVGDVAFQQKCLGRIGEVAESGRTILFVSHNMAAVQSLCNKAVVLDEGRVVFTGSSEEGVRHYMHLTTPTEVKLRDRQDRQGTGEMRIVDIAVTDAEGREVQSLSSGSDLYVHLTAERTPEANIKDMSLNITVKNQFDQPLFIQRTNAQTIWPASSRTIKAICRIEKVPLVESNYRIDVAIKCRAKRMLVDEVDNVAEFRVERSDYFGSPEIAKNNKYLCLTRGEWNISAG
jgi:lipopolysaccharide transport system ATP-binding protein